VMQRFCAAADAVERGDADLLRRLVRQHPSLLVAMEAEDHQSTLLHRAAAGEQSVIVSVLLELGAAVDAMTWATPLHDAAGYGRTENARLLLEAGAAFDARTDLGTTPLAMAVLHGHPDVADLLSPRGIIPRTLWVAAGAGDLALVQSFCRPDGTLTEGADAHREDPHEYGLPARPRSDEPTAIREEALKYACANARTEVARYLLDAGVDINSTSHVGTPLHWAAYSGHLEMARFLVERGADASALDDEWSGTPGSWAAQRGHRAVVEFLGQYEV
jgi:ankyrin repeat protein